MNETVSIPVSSERDFLAFVEKLNKKARRHGVPELTCQRVAGSERMEDQEIILRVEGEETSRKVKTEVVDYILTGKEFSLDGWAFVATVEHTPAGNLFHKGPHSRDIEVPASYNETDACLCEHCGHNRKRNLTFIVHHAENGFKQVGSTCLKDFLGTNSVKGFEFSSLVFKKISDFIDGEFERAPSYYSLRSVLATSCAIIRKHGFVSVQKAEGMGREPTKVFVEHHLFSENSELEILDSDYELALKVYEWMKALPRDKGEYLQKLSIIGELAYVSPRNIGLVVSAPASYEREMGRKFESKVSNHVGTVKKRESFENLTVTNVKYCETPYGVSTLYLFKDENGNVLKWFSSSDIELEQGETVSLVGTVKAHEEFNGVKQTALTRCKVA